MVDCRTHCSLGPPESESCFRPPFAAARGRQGVVVSHDVKVEFWKGKGRFIGAETFEEGRRAFDRIISDYEAARALRGHVRGRDLSGHAGGHHRRAGQAHAQETRQVAYPEAEGLRPMMNSGGSSRSLASICHSVYDDQRFSTRPCYRPGDLRWRGDRRQHDLLHNG
jgi:hypothetical protein